MWLVVLGHKVNWKWQIVIFRLLMHHKTALHRIIKLSECSLTDNALIVTAREWEQQVSHTHTHARARVHTYTLCIKILNKSPLKSIISVITVIQNKYFLSKQNRRNRNLSIIIHTRARAPTHTHTFLYLLKYFYL